MNSIREIHSNIVKKKMAERNIGAKCSIKLIGTEILPKSSVSISINA